MDKPAEFYYNFPVKENVMTAKDHEERKLAHNRAFELDIRNSEFVPTLKQSFFGPGAAPVRVQNFGSVSIKQQRAVERSLGDQRALELSKRRKLTAASEKYKFF